MNSFSMMHKDGENGMDINATTTVTEKDSSYVTLPLDCIVAGGSSVDITALEVILDSRVTINSTASFKKNHPPDLPKLDQGKRTRNILLHEGVFSSHDDATRTGLGR